MATLASKLGIKEGQSVLTARAPEEYFELLDMDSSTLSLAPKEDGTYDFIHVFVSTENELVEQLELLKPKLSINGLLWISWKKGFKSFNREVVREIGLASGLVDVKVASFDETWSALKFVYRLKDRK